MLAYDEGGRYSQHHFRNTVVSIVEGRGKENELGNSLKIFEGKTGGHKSTKACTDKSKVVLSRAYFFQLMQPFLKISIKIRPDYMREICFKKEPLGSLARRIQTVEKNCSGCLHAAYAAS